MTQQDRHVGNGDLLSHREQQIAFPGRQLRRDLPGIPQQIIGGTSSGRQHRDDAVSLSVCIRDALRGVPQPFCARQRTAAILLNDQCHSFSLLSELQHPIPEGEKG